MEGSTVKSTKETTRTAERRFDLEPGNIYLVKSDVEKAYEIFTNYVLSGKSGLCITRDYPPRVREKYGLERTPIAWLTTEKNGDQITVNTLQEISLMIGDFLQKAKSSAIMVNGFECLIINHGFDAFMMFLQTCRSRIEKSNAILIAPVAEEALDTKMFKMIERETRLFTPNCKQTTEGTNS